MTGPELREARQQLGLSQSGLAERLGVHWNVIARWEREELRIAHPKMLALAIEALRRA